MCRATRFALVAIAVLASLDLFSDTEIINGIEWTYYIRNGRAIIGKEEEAHSSGWKSASPENRAVRLLIDQVSITVPSRLGGKPVRTIDRGAFYQCPKIIRVNIPASVETIGDDAFCMCSDLETVTIANGVKYIGHGAFFLCGALKSVSIPNSVTKIGGHAFSGCDHLERVYLPRGLTKISDSCFSGCESLCQIVIPDTVTTIEGHAFSHCKGLKSITFPSGLLVIENGAFWECEGLRGEVSIPASVARISNTAFKECKIDSFKVDRRNSNYRAIDGILYDITGQEVVSCPNGKSGRIKIPEGVREIRDLAFYDCSEICNVDFPNSLTNIGDRAFVSCKNLKAIEIPRNVVSIGDDAFEYCEKLKSARILAHIHKLRKENIFDFKKEIFDHCPSLTTFVLSENAIDKKSFFGSADYDFKGKEERMDFKGFHIIIEPNSAGWPGWLLGLVILLSCATLLFIIYRKYNIKIKRKVPIIDTVASQVMKDGGANPSLQSACPHCGGELEIPPEIVVGQLLICPYCEGEFTYGENR